MDPYHVLGVSPSASEGEIQAAWRRLIRVWHPDRHGSSAAALEGALEKTKLINQAYQALLASPGPTPVVMPVRISWQLSLRGGVLRFKSVGDLAVPPGCDVGHAWAVGRTTVRVAEVAPHPIFRRCGLEVHMGLRVPLAELALGGHVSIEGPWGALGLRIPPRSLAPFSVRGHGIRLAEREGDLIVHPAIRWPDDDSGYADLLGTEEVEPTPHVHPVNKK